MTLPRTVRDVLDEHTTLEVESIDRMYLNVYVPPLQYDGGVATFFRKHRGQPFASSVLMAPISQAFIAAIEAFVAEHRVPLITFKKGQRKDEVMAAHLARFTGEEGVLFVGKAQEKATVFRTEKRRNPQTGQPYPWLVRSTAMVNHYYFYAVDRDFGPFFLKFCSYFPYNAKLCLNGHEYLKRQLSQRGIAYEALDNGIRACVAPAAVQHLADGLSAAKIEAVLHKWFGRLPHPFGARDRRAGYRYRCSILQSEFSLTQALDQPVMGRMFFEQVIRENLDLGRPDHVQLIFGRRVSARTPGRFRTRVITEGVTPSLHIDYKHSRIKQYHKNGRALRTETTINDPRDFDIRKGLSHLSALRKVGFQANRRLLDVQRISQDCAMGEAAFVGLSHPVTVDRQRAAALRWADPVVQALFSALIGFRLVPDGWRQRDLRAPLAALLGVPPQDVSAGRMTYQLRRLRVHGLIERVPHTHRYQVTARGLRIALFFTRVHARLFRPGLAAIMPEAVRDDSRLRRAFTQLERAIDQWCEEAKLAA
jgi:hypothetical protein